MLKFRLIQTPHGRAKMTCYQANFYTNFLSSIPDNIEELCDEITRLAGHINAANYRFLKLLPALASSPLPIGSNIIAASRSGQPVRRWRGLFIRSSRRRKKTFPRKRFLKLNGNTKSWKGAGLEL